MGGDADRKQREEAEIALLRAAGHVVKRFVVHAGYERMDAANPSGWRSFYDLVELYGLDREECIDHRAFGATEMIAKSPYGLTHIHPNPNGQYPRQRVKIGAGNC